MLKKLALFIIACGVIAMLGYYTMVAVSDADIPVGLGISIVVIMAGCLLMVVAVARERYREWKSEDKDFRDTKH